MLKVRRASFFVTQEDLVAAEADYPPPSGKSSSDGLSARCLMIRETAPGARPEAASSQPEPPRALSCFDVVV